ncbi:elongation factor P [Candidatus Saccharibacteria bacterium]|nr:elongation factor P [Candidatus Saccharibacteria bacterium]
MYGPTDLRKDTLIDLDGTPFKVVDYAQKQMGRGGSIVNTKLKNLITGGVIDRTFRNDERIKPADLARIKLQYLYTQGNTYSLMDMESYETYEIATSVDGDVPKYITEGGEIEGYLFSGQIIGFEWPKNVQLKVTEAPGGDKGNSAAGATKAVKLETGIEVQAPLFIKVGDMVKVDTRTGAYLERVK